MSEPIPRDRIRMFDKSGLPLCAFNAAIDRSWAINEEGRAQFTLPTRLSWVNETNFAHGNWILIENTILPAWVGMLDTPRTSNALEITFSAYTPDHLFTQRIAPIDESLNFDAGGWFNWFIGFTNSMQTLTILQSGEIFFDGQMLPKVVCPRFLAEYLQEVVDESAQEYEFIPQVNRNRLSILGNWSSHLGVDTQYELKYASLGGNVEDGSVFITDDGPLANDIFLFGEGASWRSRPYAKAWDLENIGKYGLRHYTEEIEGAADSATLQGIANRKLEVMKKGVKVISLNAINVGDTFKYLKIGNTIRAVLPKSDFGYSGNARITGMRYDPLKPNKVELVLEAE